MAGRERLSDEEARVVFSDVFDASFDDILLYCRRRTRSSQDAEDAVSETYLVAWRRVEELAAAESSVAWLFGVAHRVLSNQRRGRDRFDRLVARTAYLVGARGPQDPADAVVAKAAVREVYSALASLNELDRELILLSTLEGLPHAEIGVALNLPTRVVRGRLYRARERLNKKVLILQRDKQRKVDTSTGEGNSAAITKDEEAT